MESAHDEIPCVAGIHQTHNTLFHLPRGFIGESKRHNTAGRHSLLQEISDAVGQYPRLAGSGAGDNKRRSFGICYRLTLGGIQLV